MKQENQSLEICIWKTIVDDDCKNKSKTYIKAQEKDNPCYNCNGYNLRCDNYTPYKKP